MFSKPIYQFMIRQVGLPVFLGVTAVLLFITPLVLAWLIAAPFLNGGRRGSRYGLAVGLAVAIWASLCFLCVPYVGAYPNLIGGALALVAVDLGADATWSVQLCIHGTNFVIWPLFGWVLHRSRC